MNETRVLSHLPAALCRAGESCSRASLAEASSDPIDALAHSIGHALEESDVVAVCGGPGTGKLAAVMVEAERKGVPVARIDPEVEGRLDQATSKTAEEGWIIWNSTPGSGEPPASLPQRGQKFIVLEEPPAYEGRQRNNQLDSAGCGDMDAMLQRNPELAKQMQQQSQAQGGRDNGAVTIGGVTIDKHWSWSPNRP